MKYTKDDIEFVRVENLWNGALLSCGGNQFMVRDVIGNDDTSETVAVVLTMIAVTEHQKDGFPLTYTTTMQFPKGLIIQLDLS